MNDAVAFPLDEPELSFTASGDSLVRRTILPSGVRILSESVPGSRSATIGYWVAVGSRDELPANYGSTHFLEHLLFKGTPTRSALDIAISFDAVGGEHNAMTAKEYTCYYAKVQDRDLPMAVDVLTDMLTSSRLDPTEFENERGVILEELAMADDDPSDVAGERFFEAVFGAHPLGRPIGGNPETIQAATRDAVWDHYRANYRPQDLVISVAGAVDHDLLVVRVTAALEAAGWDLSIPGAPVGRRSGEGVEIARGSALTTVHRPIEQANIMLGVPGIVAADDRRAHLSVLNSVLGGGMSSRLFQQLREERGLAYSVYSMLQPWADTGLFSIYAATAQRQSAAAAQLIEEVLADAAETITERELMRVRTQAKAGLLMSLESPWGQAHYVARQIQTYGRLVEPAEVIADVETVDLERIREAGRKMLSGARARATIGFPAVRAA